MNIPINLSIDSIVSSLSKEEALNLIIALDENVREVDFTLEVIQTLIERLKSDMAEEELKQDVDKFIQSTSKVKICDNCHMPVDIATNIGHASWCSKHGEEEDGDN